MHKNKVNVRELVDKYQSNCDRITAIADTCEKEQRERTDAETKEYETLVRENQILSMKLQAAAADHLRENPNARQDAVKIIRENAAKGAKTEIAFVRDIMMVSDMTDKGTIPLNVQDIIKPLTEGFILDKVGLPFNTGLSGDFVWPMYEMVEAQFAGEGVALGDTKIPFSKMQAQPERMGIAVPVSNQALNQTDGLLEMVVREVMPMAIRLLLNKVLFGVRKVNTAAHTVGPFVAAKAAAITITGMPTFRKLNADMKAAVLETGIDGSHLCWVMTKSMAAKLEGEPINPEGVYVPMLQSGRLCDLPVYTTNEIRGEVFHAKWNGTKWEEIIPLETDTVTGIVDTAAKLGSDGKINGTGSAVAVGTIYKVVDKTEYIGLGDWRYQPMGMFGELRFIVDPYSQARKDCVDFVLNADYATKTLRPEAFKLAKVVNT